MPKHVHLIPIDTAFRTALEGGPSAFLLRYRCELGDAAELVREAARASLAAGVAKPPWGGYLGLDEFSRQAVGTCTFRGVPTPGGDVEIAYATFPAYAGQGYATAMAARLLEIAWADGRVEQVLAHTPAEAGPAARILEKLGFRKTEVRSDPEGGTACAWVRRRPGFARSGITVPLPA